MTSPIEPTIGRIVLIDEGDGKVRPAIITKVWSNDLLNVMLFVDNEGAQPRTSVPYEENASGRLRWYWMDYQKKVAGV
jgi:hypothetical protein